MKLQIVRREDAARPYLTLVNAATRKQVAILSAFDNAFTSTRIEEAVNLYADLIELGLLKPVLAAVQKRLDEQFNGAGGTTPPAHP